VPTQNAIKLSSLDEISILFWLRLKIRFILRPKVHRAMRQGEKKHNVKQMLMLMSLSRGYHLKGRVRARDTSAGGNANESQVIERQLQGHHKLVPIQPQSYEGPSLFWSIFRFSWNYLIPAHNLSPLSLDKIKSGTQTRKTEKPCT